MTPPRAGLADEAYARVNCYGIGRWLEALYQDLGQRLPLTPEPWESHSTSRVHGLVFTVYRDANIFPRPALPQDALVLSEVEGDASAPMPRGLNAANETVQSAVSKLSAATEGGSPARIAAGDTRVSYFMPDGKVVQLRFKQARADQGLVGFDRIVFVALGTASAYKG